MNVAEEIARFFEMSEQAVFIEAEGKPNKIRNFVDDYNRKYNENLDMYDDGLIVLQEDADKWGLELRLYFDDASGISAGVQVTKNTVYRSEYSFRINDVEIIKDLFDYGYRIGLN